MRPIRTRRLLAAISLGAVIASAAGCALLVPKAWRIGSPVPLAGEIHARDAGQTDLGEIPTDALRQAVEADQRRLSEIAAETGDDVTAEHRIEEARAIAERLPALQEELAARADNEGKTRSRHPTIR